MKKKIRLLVYMSLIMFLIVGCSPKTDVPNQEEDIKDDENYAPDFELETITGDTIRLSDLKGKKVIINFWATWCPYCKDEMPDLQKLYDKYKDDNLIILAIDVGETKEEVTQFVESNNLTFPVLLDIKSEVVRNYGVNSFPTTIAIDEEGIVIVGKVGMMTYEQMELMYSYFENN